jgi:hypothetical protein
MIRRRALDVALLGALLILTAVFIRAGLHPTESDPSSADGLDLLRLIDPERDAVFGGWRLSGSTLITPAVPFGRLQIPCEAPNEYDLELEVERTKGEDSFDLGLVFGSRQIVLIIDGWEKGERTGIDLVDNKPFFLNETTRGGRLLDAGRRHGLHFSVRSGSVGLRVDGAIVVDWKGDPGRVGLYEGWKVRDSKALFVGSYGTEFRIHSFQLKWVSASPRTPP